MKDPKNMSDAELATTIRTAFDKADVDGREWFAACVLDAVDSPESILALHKAIIAYMNWGTSPEYLKEVQEDTGENPADIAEEFVNQLRRNARQVAFMLLQFADAPLQEPKV